MGCCCGDHCGLVFFWEFASSWLLLSLLGRRLFWMTFTSFADLVCQATSEFSLFYKILARLYLYLAV